jgi:hypothetical protein
MTTDATSQRNSWTQRRTRRAVLVAFAVIAVLAAMAFKLGTASRHTFTISGSTPAGMLRPGVAVPVDLTLTNPNDSSLQISRLLVTVAIIQAPRSDPSHPCSAADFGVVQFSGPGNVKLAASSSRSLSSLGIPQGQWPQVTMANRPVNQDGCKDASLTLGFTGVARSKGI